MGEYIQKWLGEKPFILIELKTYDEGSDEMVMSMEFGGGLDEDSTVALISDIAESYKR